MKRGARLYAGLLALPLLTLCASAQAEAEAESKMIAAVTTVGELPSAPPHQWSDLAADLNDNRAAGNGLVSAPALQRYLNRLYTSIKTAAGVPEWPGQVYISSDTTLNAHASASNGDAVMMRTAHTAHTAVIRHSRTDCASEDMRYWVSREIASAARGRTRSHHRSRRRAAAANSTSPISHADPNTNAVRRVSIRRCVSHGKLARKIVMGKTRSDSRATVKPG